MIVTSTYKKCGTCGSREFYVSKSRMHCRRCQLASMLEKRLNHRAAVEECRERNESAERQRLGLQHTDDE